MVLAIIFIVLNTLRSNHSVAVQQFGILRVQAQREDSVVFGKNVMRSQHQVGRDLRQPTVSVRRIRFETSDQST